MSNFNPSITKLPSGCDYPKMPINNTHCLDKTYAEFLWTQSDSLMYTHLVWMGVGAFSFFLELYRHSQCKKDEGATKINLRFMMVIAVIVFLQGIDPMGMYGYLSWAFLLGPMISLFGPVIYTLFCRYGLAYKRVMQMSKDATKIKREDMIVNIFFIVTSIYFLAVFYVIAVMFIFGDGSMIIGQNPGWIGGLTYAGHAMCGFFVPMFITFNTIPLINALKKSDNKKAEKDKKHTKTIYKLKRFLVFTWFGFGIGIPDQIFMSMAAFAVETEVIIPLKPGQTTYYPQEGFFVITFMALWGLPILLIVGPRPKAEVEKTNKRLKGILSTAKSGVTSTFNTSNRRGASGASSSRASSSRATSAKSTSAAASSVSPHSETSKREAI